MFRLKGNANPNEKKVMAYGEMKYGDEHFSMAELENANGHEREESYR